MQHQAYNEAFLDFLGRATTPFHAVREMCRQLGEAGFTALNETDEWTLVPGAGYYLVRNDSTLVAFRVGSAQAPEQGLRMVGAHTDSPCLMVKPNPEKSSQGYALLGVEVYGGALLNPWYDRDLSLAGRVTYLDSGGELRKQLLDFRNPIAIIPSLAIHLDREANKSRSINPQTDILPMLGRRDEFDLRSLLSERLLEEYPGADVAEVLDYELCFYDSQAPALTGLDSEFISSARLDNLLSCFAGMTALLQADTTVSSLLVCNDHEEVGSLSAAGAQGPMLAGVLQRLAPGPAAYAALVERSLLISCDNAHGVHPNYATKHDDNHGPLLNGGPVIKLNANQRYATNSETAAFFRRLCREQEVPVQSFVVRTDMACGSTIGPLTAGEIGVRTLDVGVAQFAMHSVREICGSRDPADLAAVLTRFMGWQGALSAAGG